MSAKMIIYCERIAVATKMSPMCSPTHPRA